MPHYEEKRILEMSGVDCTLKGDSILSRLKRQIEENPEQSILSDDSSSINYKDFDLKSNGLANYLKENFDLKK